MIIIVTTIVTLVVGFLLYRSHHSLRPMSSKDVAELHKKFHEAYRNVDPKPKMEITLNKQRHPAYLYLNNGHNNFLMLAWENKKSPSIKKYSKDPQHYHATHQFLEHFNIKPPH
jgi:hypothetical protein